MIDASVDDAKLHAHMRDVWTDSCYFVVMSVVWIYIYIYIHIVRLCIYVYICFRR